MVKRIVSLCLVFALLTSFSFAGAVDPYQLEDDTKVSLMSSAYDVMPLDITSSDLDTYLGLNSLVYQRINAIYNVLYKTTGTSLYSLTNNLDTNVSSLVTKVTGLQTSLSAIVTDTDFLSTYFSTGSAGSFTATLKRVLGYESYPSATVAGQLSSIQLSNSAINSQVGNIISSLNSTVSSYLGSSGNVVEGTAGISDLLANGFVGLRSLLYSTRTRYLNNEGTVTYGSSSLSLSDVAADGFLGLRNYLAVDAGNYFMGSDGTITSLTFPYPVVNFLASFSRGVQALLSGEQSDNRYSVELTDNSLVSSSVSKRGLGPMLSAYLDSVENHTALLSYVFASPQDLELKKESEDNMTAVGDSFLSSDSSSSVKVKDITDISSASDSIQALGETGVTPGQAFAQLGNSDLFRFFSAETAADLDTTVSTYADDPSRQIVTNYYEQNRLEFFETIGKGGG